MQTNTESAEMQETPHQPSFRLWNQRNFISLMLGTGLSVLGDGAYFIVLGWFVLSVTKSEFALGTTLTLASIPRIVFMLVGGVVADRVNRKQILVASLLLRFIVLLAFVSVLISLHSETRLWTIDLMALVFGSIDAFFYPASNSVVPSAVPAAALAQANSLVQTIQQISTVLGPLLAAALLWMGGYAVMFLCIAIVFGLSSVALSLLRLRTAMSPEGVAAADTNGGAMGDSGDSECSGGLPGRNCCENNDAVVEEPPSSMFRDIFEGIKYVKSVRILVLIMVVSLGINLLFMGPINIGVPTFVKSMGWSGDVYGSYESGFGVGTVMGGIVVILLKGLRGRFRWLGGFGVLMGAGCAGIGFVHVPWGGIALMAVMGMAVSIVDIPILTYIQAIVPADKLGRTMSLLTLMGVGLVPVSYTVSSFLLQQNAIQVKDLLLVCGSAIAILFLCMYLFRDFRQVENHPLWRSRIAAGGNEALESSSPSL